MGQKHQEWGNFDLPETVDKRWLYGETNTRCTPDTPPWYSEPSHEPLRGDHRAAHFRDCRRRGRKKPVDLGHAIGPDDFGVHQHPSERSLDRDTRETPKPTILTS